MSRWHRQVDEDLDAIDPTEWDALLTPGDHLASHRFLRVCRDARIADARFRYLRVFHDGRLAATAALTAMTVSLDLLAPHAVQTLTHAARVVYPGFLRVPVLFCGLPVSFGSSCLRVAPWAESAGVFSELTEAMEEFADSESSGILCTKELTEAERVHADALLGFGFMRVPSLPGESLFTAWPTFEAYVASMRSSYRRQMRASIERCAQRGLHARVVRDWGEQVARIYPLYEEVMDRADHQLERLPIAFFERLSEELAGDARAILLEREGRLEAAAILLDGPRTLTFLLGGLDHARGEADGAYPGLVAEVVAEGIRSHAARVELGQTSYALKSRFGAVASPRWLYVRHRRALSHEALRGCSRFLFPEERVPVRRVFAEPDARAARSSPLPPDSVSG